MKLPSSKSFLAACALCVASVTVSTAATVSTGDLLIGFRTTTNDGSQGSSYSYIVNVGQASLYGGDTGAVTNVGADLAAIFGDNWATRTDIQWGVIGTAGVSNIYLSKAETTSGVNPDGWVFGSTAEINTVRSDIRAIYGISNPGGFDESTATINLAGGRESNSSTNSWRSYLNPDQYPANSDLDSPGNIEGLLSNNLALFHTTGAGAAGTSYVTTFTIDSTGQISAVPEPSSLLTLAGGSLLLFVRRRRA
ncbi:MAG: PEP-CTERM sorting domain-containing protein [Luteolibacter sp.]